MKILMVCLGNICRSPLAEGILKEKVKKHNLNWVVESRGTGGWHVGNLPDPRSIEKAAEYGIDITDQRSQKIHRQDLEDFDIIYAMDSSNYNDIRKLATTYTQKDKVKLIMNESKPNFNIGVPDPYWGDDGFEEVYQMLEEACEAVIEKYK